MASLAQISANRENAQKSTGPKTEAGKAVSSKNNFNFGFNAKVFAVIEGESQEDFDRFRQELLDEHRPATPTEFVFVESMAQHHWASLRAQRLQDSCFGNDGVDEARLTLYLRYQNTHMRLFHKSLNELQKLRAEKRKVEIGFESQKHKAAEESRRQSAQEVKQKVLERKVWLTEQQVLNQSLHNEQFEIFELRGPGVRAQALAAEQAAQKAQQAA
jgi:hypothetical protein